MNSRRVKHQEHIRSLQDILMRLALSLECQMTISNQKRLRLPVLLQDEVAQQRPLRRYGSLLESPRTRNQHRGAQELVPDLAGSRREQARRIR